MSNQVTFSYKASEETADKFPYGASIGNRYDLFFFSIVDFSYLHQRPQQLASHFAKRGHRVFYLNMTQFLPADARKSFRIRESRKNLYEVFLKSPAAPRIYEDFLEAGTLDLLYASLVALRSEWGLITCVSLVHNPFWTPLALRMRDEYDWKIHYDCMDEWETFKNIGSPLVEKERELVEKADLVSVTAELLFSKWKNIAGDCFLSRNACDYEHFEDPMQSNLMAGIKRPIVGFFGGIADWFDVDMIAYAANQRKEWSFVLLGGISTDVSPIKELPNVILSGAKPYGDMPAYLNNFDVCIIPFKKNRVTEAADPVKLYEYFSSGKPVVARDLNTIREHRDCLYLYDSEEGLVQGIEKALAENDPEVVRKRKQMAASNTWAHRIAAMEQETRKQYKKASVLLAARTHEPFLEMCMENLLEKTDYPNLEVILVENRPRKEVLTYLDHLQKRYDWIKSVATESNLSMAYRLALEKAEGDYIVFLSGKSLVTRGWLTKLINYLERNPVIGVIGPAPVDWSDPATRAMSHPPNEIERAACAGRDALKGIFFHVDPSPEYCVATKREVLDKIGCPGKDSRSKFKVEDLSKRVKREGYWAVCAGDIFVHDFSWAGSIRSKGAGRLGRIWNETKRLLRLSPGHAELFFRIAGGKYHMDERKSIFEKEASSSRNVEEGDYLRKALHRRELELSVRDKKIHAFGRELHQKDVFIAQQQKEITRLKGLEKSIFFGMAIKLSKWTNEVILPSGTWRGKLVYRLIQRFRGSFQEIPLTDPGGEKDLPATPRAFEAVESLTIDQMEPLRFMNAVEPRVSVVIPTWNRCAHLYHCLKSLVENTSDVLYEVIVVDNGSTDETPALLNRTENIRVIGNNSNLGFAKACNEGAKAARGEYLLFLNNDAEVEEGSLKAMVDLIDTDKTIGAVGAKLVFPDGTLQEAGSIIWRDGSALGYGRGEDPGHPQFCYLREVDFCSAACLLVRKEIFSKLGGFDEIYSPAYYEDADLCFGVRDLGFRVVCHPDVKIIHHEFGSSSKEKSRDLCSLNRGKFVKKWEKALKEHLSPGPGNILRARDKRKGMKILALDDIVPATSMGSGYPRSNAILKGLAEMGHLVTFHPISDAFPYQPYTDELRYMGVEVFCGGNMDIHDLLRERKGFYDAVLISRPHNAASIIAEVRKYFPKARIIYDAEAIYANREMNRLKLKGVKLKEREQAKMILKELAPMKYADAIIVTSAYEKNQVLAFRTQDVFVWGHPLEVNPPEKGFSDRNGLLFVGGFLTSPSPNEDAMIHFVKNIFPKINGTLGCRLFIVGMNQLNSVKGLRSDWVTVTGFVEDLREYYERCRVFVVPTRFAAGIPLKLLEAMSHGIPAVVTPLIAEELGLSEGEGLLIGKDDADFARKVTELYRNETLWHDIQEKALEYVRLNCDREKMKLHLDRIIKGETSPSPLPSPLRGEG